FTVGVKSTVTNKYVVESGIVKKHNYEKENHENLPSTSTYNECSSETLKPSDNLCDNFKKQVLRQLQIISLRQQQMSEDLSVLLMKANSEKDEPIVSNEESIFKRYNFPLKELQELEELENFLIQDKSFNYFVKEIMQIGGTTYKHMIKRVLPKIMSNDLAKTYSWIGFKGKHNFSTLRTCSAILIATQRTHRCSEAVIEDVIKYWLVKSTERQKQSQKEKKL
ncbi:PREDICTED: uncharacterized protein LOC105565501, partial [Vollenhovia emeryi]|uniref:uncharacterized protein LOC105565501 n=1 Tax=Vollenhovia emeryi TaxID=411798 RepID=UPI0005F3B7A1